MDTGLDFLVYTPDRQPRLAVEVKASRGVDEEWASRFWRTLTAHALVSSSTSFLLAAPDRLYYWRSGAENAEQRPASFRTREALAPYLASWSTADLSEPSLELAVKSWLSDLMSSDVSSATASDPVRWAKQSGLYDEIRGGSIERPSAR